MIIRNINGNDMNEIIALWKKTLPYLVIDRKIFMNKIFMDPNFNEKGFFVAEENGKIVGFANAIYRKLPLCPGDNLDERRGYIAGFAFDENRPDVAEAVLEKCEKYLLENGKTIIYTGYYPYFVQGVDEQYMKEIIPVFEKRGYLGKRSFSMVLDLEKYCSDDVLAKKRAKLAENGIEVISLNDEYITKLFTLENAFLRPAWLLEYKLRAKDMDFERVKIAVKGGKILGACIFSDPESIPERFGPFGVDPECRGMGIGGVLLDAVLTEMKSRGLKFSWMQWCSDDKGAAVIYERAGFKPRDYYLEFEKIF